MNFISTIYDFLVTHSPKIVIVASIVAAIGAYLITVKNSNTSTTIKSKIDANNVISLKNQQLSNENKALSEHNIDLSNKVVELANSNLSLTAKVNEALDYTKNYVTGGDSYCLVNLGIDQQQKVVTLTMIDRGKFPLQNLKYRIHNSATDPNPETPGYLDWVFSITKNIGTLEPDNAIILDSYLVVNGTLHLSIIMHCNTGHFHQTIRVVEINGRLEHATKLIGGPHNRTEFFKFVSPNFPTESFSEFKTN